MFEILLNAFLGGLLCLFTTGLGAMIAFIKTGLSGKKLDCFFGFSIGIMMAASFFSLLQPALEMGGIIIASIGFLTGSILMYGSDLFIPHVHPFKADEEKEKSGRLTKIITAVTLHNLPEGFSVGVVFGSGNLKAAWGLTSGIALQDFPEGASVSIPFVKLGKSRGKAVLLGVASGIVEPLGALFSAFLVQVFQWLLPFFLAFGAGAMIYVIGSEMIPEAHSGGFGKDTMFFMIIGFITMMILDVVL
ncbi:MAG: ZIP family metal transporter [Crenarchaeota archaeon]|nr:ZIP family metal transporter [Thermoproteota archaeon]MDW8034165.1 ZIP family metal transporter [Nitrososphaerota archaeon]